MSSCYKSVLRCASLSAFESGIFELLGQLYPLAYFFFVKKSKSPKASEATNNAVGPNVLDQHRMIPTECSFIPDVRQEADNIKSNWYKMRDARRPHPFTEKGTGFDDCFSPIDIA